MRFIPTKFHAPLDYIVGAALIASPWIFSFSDTTAPTVVSIALGIGLIAYSLITNYELGVWKLAPMAVHNLIDVVAGALLASAVAVRLRRRSRERVDLVRRRRPRCDLPRTDHQAVQRLQVRPQRAPGHGLASFSATLGAPCGARRASPDPNGSSASTDPYSQLG